MTLVLQNTNGKSFVVNIIDTPGHVNFEDEVAAGVRLSDGAIIVVDVAEGVSASTLVQMQAAEGCLHIPGLARDNACDTLSCPEQGPHDPSS